MEVEHQYNKSIINRLSQKSNTNQINEIKKQNNENFDPKTGQPYFHPQIGRGPANDNRGKDGQDIGEYLYNQGKVKQDHLKNKQME